MEEYPGDLVLCGSFLPKLGIQNVEIVLHTSIMRWFRHVERSAGWISQMPNLKLDFCKKPESRKKTWNEFVLNEKKAKHGLCRFPQLHRIKKRL